MFSWMRAVEQHVLLQHDADLAAQPAGIELRDVDAVEHHLAVLRAVEPLHQLGQGRLAGAGLADEADDLAGGDLDSVTFLSASGASGR